MDKRNYTIIYCRNWTWRSWLGLMAARLLQHQQHSGLLAWDKSVDSSPPYRKHKIIYNNSIG